MAHWADEKERGGGYWQLKLMLTLRRALGRRLCAALMRPVVLVFYLTAPRARSASIDFLTRAAAAVEPPRPEPSSRESYRHFVSFGEALLDKVDAWSSLIRVGQLVSEDDDLDELVDALRSKSGATLLCSHLGNAELLRALASLEVGGQIEGFSFTSIVEFSGTAKFNRLIAEIDPRSMGELVPASDIGPDTMIALKERVDSGGLVVIAGDRVAAANRDKVIALDFFGDRARFPYGPFLLADLLESPVYFMSALRERDLDWRSPYIFHILRARSPSGGDRRGRDARIAALAAEYASSLEREALEHPYQWYNFFDFWEKGGSCER
jgi:predicted LPLAT superfamily acyltransferase